MPLTDKGEKIKAALTSEYGAKKGEEVLYAGKNKGTFTGIEATKALDDCSKRIDALTGRMDAWEKRKDAVEFFRSSRSCFPQVVRSTGKLPLTFEDYRELGQQGIWKPGSYKPKIGDYVDYYDRNGDKKYGKITAYDGSTITIDGHKLKIK